jgi:hypothetical protein
MSPHNSSPTVSPMHTLPFGGRTAVPSGLSALALCIEYGGIV